MSKYHETLDQIYKSINGMLNPYPVPERILKSGPVTIVFWDDGTKTLVRPESGTDPDDYAAFTAAVAKKLYGSNSHIKKIMKEVTEIQTKKEW